jgi:glycosyltransferase involved in cell wall biosynthesis
MASKVPVISTNTGGLPEVNIDGVTGFTSNVGDIDDMAANALKILTDPITHSQFRENAYNKAKEFDINNILPQYEAVYARVLNRAVIAE